MFAWSVYFPAAMLVSLGGTRTWQLHTGLCKLVQNIFEKYLKFGKTYRPKNLEKCNIYLSPITWWFPDFIHEMVVELSFNCLTVQPKNKVVFVLASVTGGVLKGQCCNLRLTSNLGNRKKVYRKKIVRGLLVAWSQIYKCSGLTIQICSLVLYISYLSTRIKRL